MSVAECRAFECPWLRQELARRSPPTGTPMRSANAIEAIRDAQRLASVGPEPETSAPNPYSGTLVRGDPAILPRAPGPTRPKTIHSWRELGVRPAPVHFRAQRAKMPPLGNSGEGFLTNFVTVLLLGPQQPQQNITVRSSRAFTAADPVRGSSKAVHPLLQQRRRHWARNPCQGADTRKSPRANAHPMTGLRVDQMAAPPSPQ